MSLFGSSGARKKALALFDSASQLAQHGDVAGAIRVFEQVIDLWKKIDDLPAVVKTLDAMAKLLATHGDAERALAHWKRAFDLVVGFGDTHGQGLILANIAMLKAAAGDLADASASADRAITSLAAVGDLDGLASMLWNVGVAAGNLGDRARALRYLQELVDVANRAGDEARKELALRAIGQIHFVAREFAQALARWQAAYELRRERLGDPVGAAITLANIADCWAEQDDRPRALSLWKECLATFEGAGDQESRAMILHRMAEAANRQGDLDGALDLMSSALEIFAKLGDRQNQGATFAAMASVLEKQGRRQRAIDSWRQAIALFETIGDVEGKTKASRELAILLEGPAATLATPPVRASGGAGDVRVLERTQALSLSEYDLAPRSAPHFAIGEHLASLHARGSLHDLRPGSILLEHDGTAVVASAGNPSSGHALDPERMGANLQSAHASHVWEDFRAILAGYTRAGYEGIDTLHPGFTDAVLDSLGAPEDRPRPARPPIAGDAVLRALRSQLVVRENLVALVPAQDGASATAEAPLSPEAFIWVISAMALGVDCTSLFDSDRIRADSESAAHLFQFLRYARCEPGVEYGLSPRPPDGVELAMAVGVALRNEGTQMASHRLEAVRPAIRKVLTEGPLHQAEKLGETLVDVALTCSRLPGLELFGPQAWAQQAIIFSQYLARGTRRDEIRLSALTRRLHDHPWFSFPVDHRQWPRDQQELSLANSLLMTYRDLAKSSLTEQAPSRPGILWSAARRAVALSRTMVRRYQAISPQLPATEAVMMLRLLHNVLNSYAQSLDCMADAAIREHESLGGSTWLTFFTDQPGQSSFLGAEFRWATEFLTALGNDHSPDTVRSFLDQGAQFLEPRSDRASTEADHLRLN